VSTKKVIEQIVNTLMAACKDCHPQASEPAPLFASLFTSTQSTCFWLGKAGRDAIKHAIAKCVPFLDRYPIRTLEATLQVIVADAKETTTTPADASAALRSKLVAFFEKIDAPPEWEVVIAVCGLSGGQAPFHLGPCCFFIMDPEEHHRWGQREYSGLHDPPPETPVLEHPGGFDPSTGRWSATGWPPFVSGPPTPSTPRRKQGSGWRRF
jgi:hypothetical protein